jgi:hypothetical protein
MRPHTDGNTSDLANKMKQLERLLVMQGRRCFFCDEVIPAGEASVEHLVASSNGGSNEDDNCVACCKAVNAAFGSKPYKEKLRSVLNHRGMFVCPRQHANLVGATAQPAVPEADDPQVALVVADLTRRGTSRPKKEQTLRNTVASVFQKRLAEEELSALLARLQDRKYLSIIDGVVGYRLPKQDG